MTSSDNQQYVTVEVFNEGIAGLRTEIRELVKRFDVLETRMGAVEDTVLINSVKVEKLHHVIGWGFAGMALIIAFVGCVITLAPMLKEMYKESRRSAQHERDIRGIQEEIARLKAGQ